MAGRTLITPLSVTRATLATMPAPTTAADVTNGNFFVNDGFTALIVVNGDSAAHTLTVQMVAGSDGISTGPRTYPIVVSGQRQWTGVFPIAIYGTQLQFNLDSTLISVQAMSFLSV